MGIQSAYTCLEKPIDMDNLVLLLEKVKEQKDTGTLRQGRATVHNTGAAFSLLANAGGWQKYFFIVLSTVVSVHHPYILAMQLDVLADGFADFDELISRRNG